MQKVKQLVILYGPPGSGKGTQGELLKEQGYIVISSGDSIREFTSKSHTDKKSHKLALKLKNTIDQGNLIDFEDLKTIIEHTIRESFEQHDLIFIEGIPRQPEQARWLESFCVEGNIRITVAHLFVALEEVIKRNSNRFYVPGKHKPYISYDAALADCPEGVEPVRRKDDTDTEIIKKRYAKQYSEDVEEILSVFSNSACSQVVEIDAQKPPKHVFLSIKKLLAKIYRRNKKLVVTSNAGR